MFKVAYKRKFCVLLKLLGVVFMLNFKRKRVLNPNLMVKVILLSVFIGAFTVTASLSVDAAQISLEEELAILTGQDNHSKYLPNDSEEEEEDCYEPSELSMMSEYIPPRAPTGGNNRNEMGSESVEERQKIDQDWEVLIFNDRENQRQATMGTRQYFANILSSQREPHDTAEENAATTNVNTQPEPIDYGEPSDPAEAALINALRRHNVRRFRDLPIPLQRQLEWELDSDLINNIRRNESPAICILANVIVNVISTVTSNVASFVQSYFNNN